MKKGSVLENIQIEKLVFGGKGFVRLDDGKVCFITGGAIPGAIVNIKIIKKRKDYYEGQITQVVKKSEIETENYDLFPGAPWMNINYEEQLKIKQIQIEESMFHLKKYQEDINFLPIIPAPSQFGYRNKIEFSFGKYISHRDDIAEHFNVGFHKRGEFSKVEDYDECLLIDERQNEIYKAVKQFCKDSGLPVYDQKMNRGFWRHFMMRRMHFSEDILIVLSVYPDYFNSEDFSENTSILNSFSSEEKEAAASSLSLQERVRERCLSDIRVFLKELTGKYSDIKSVYISHNANKADTLIGDMELVCGEENITETLLGLTFDIGPKSFFQTNSQGAEVLYSLVREFVHISPSSQPSPLEDKGETEGSDNFEVEAKQKGQAADEMQSSSPIKGEDKVNCEARESDLGRIQRGGKQEKIGTVLDLYAGTGTIGMIFADIASEVISVELVEEASKSGAKNAQKNGISNMSFVNAKVEEFLDDYLGDRSQVTHIMNSRPVSGTADLLIIDPPRAGMHPSALPNILKFGTQQMIYVSCNPATLSRDLEYILKNSDYQIEKVQAVDMFPHTHHIETVVSLVKKES